MKLEQKFGYPKLLQLKVPPYLQAVNLIAYLSIYGIKISITPSYQREYGCLVW